MLLSGAFFFAFQIYADFSGYSDIAIGVAKLFGIELLRNFSYPYFSRDIAEFWRRWHISLSSWFRDYLYIPLGGSKTSMLLKIRNTFIIFLVSGFWHGANWTFIAWGFLNALYIMPSILFKTNRNNIDIVARGKYFPTIKEFFSIFTTFCLTVFAWIFFRADSVQHAFSYISGIASASLISRPADYPLKLIVLILAFLLIEWLGREHSYAIETFGNKSPLIIRWGFYYTLVLAVLYFAGAQEKFIYFQF